MTSFVTWSTLLSVSHQVNSSEARTHLSRLLERVQAGEEITIAKAGNPIARLSAIHEWPMRRVPDTPILRADPVIGRVAVETIW